MKKGYKADVWERDQLCRFCGSKGSKKNPLQVHHIIPKSEGGANSLKNCMLLCQNCHTLIHNRRLRKRRRRLESNL